MRTGVRAVLSEVDRWQRRSDSELMRAFTHEQERSAFTELVRRHGPMVFGVCRRALGDTPDADDAFQATFLALARQADESRWRGSLGGWLHQVARRIAFNLRRAEARRRNRERTATRREASEPVADVRELGPLLDEEIARLPVHLRDPIVLCHFEGRARDAVAEQIGCSLRTLERRLADARRCLRDRLTRRGITVGTTLVAAELAAGSQRIPSTLLDATLATVANPGDGPLSRIADLAGETMISTRWKWAALLGLFVTVAIGGGFALWSEEPPRPKPPKTPEKALEVGTVLLGERKFRFGPGVSSVAFSPDGKALATSGRGWGWCVWDAATGELRFHRGDPELTEPCRALFSPDGKAVSLVHGEPAPMLLTYDARTGSPIWRLDGYGGRAAAFSPKGDVLAVGTQGDRRRRETPRIVLIEVETGRVENAFNSGSSAAFAGVVFKPDQKLIAVAQVDGYLFHQELEAADFPVALYPSERHEITDLDYSPDGKLLVTCGRDGKVKFWDAEKLSPKGWVSLRNVAFTTIRFAPDGKSVAAGTAEGEVRIYDTAGNFIRKWSAHRGGDVCLDYAPNGRTLVTGTSIEARVRMWNPDTGEELVEPEPSHSEPIQKMVFADDGRTVLSWDNDGRAIRWDLATAKGTSDSTSDEQIGAASSDGRYLARVGNRGISLYDRSSRKDVFLETPLDSRLPQTVAFSGDGKVLFAVGTPSALAFAGPRVIVQRWRTSDGKALSPLAAPGFEGATPPSRNLSGPVAVSQDGSRFAVAAGFGSGIFISNAEGEPIQQLHPTGKKGRLALSPDGKRLAVTEGSRALDEPRYITQGVMSGWESHPEAPSGSRVVEMYHLDTGERLFRFVERLEKDTRGDDTQIAFSSDGKMLAVGGAASEEVQLLDPDSGKRIGSIAKLRGGVFSLTFAPDGKMLAIGDGTGGIRVEPIGEGE